VRMPRHPLALELIERVGSALVAPSANLSGTPSATRVEHVLADFEGADLRYCRWRAYCLWDRSTVLSLLEEEPLPFALGSLVKRRLKLSTL